MKKQDGTILKKITNERITTPNYNTFLFTLDKSETTYKYQGITIKEDEKYIIEEAHNLNRITKKPLMARELLITAFGRGEKFSQIYLREHKKVLKIKYPSAYDDKTIYKINQSDMKEMSIYKMYLMTQKM